MFSKERKSDTCLLAAEIVNISPLGVHIYCMVSQQCLKLCRMLPSQVRSKVSQAAKNKQRDQSQGKTEREQRSFPWNTLGDKKLVQKNIADWNPEDTTGCFRHCEGGKRCCSPCQCSWGPCRFSSNQRGGHRFQKQQRIMRLLKSDYTYSSSSLVNWILLLHVHEMFFYAAMQCPLFLLVYCRNEKLVKKLVLKPDLDCTG